MGFSIQEAMGRVRVGLRRASVSTQVVLSPETTVFPLAKREFPKGEESGISGFDLHNAVRAGAVAFGDLLEIKQGEETQEDQKERPLIYVEAGTSFVDQTTRRVFHLFWDPSLSSGLSILQLYDISSWRKTGHISDSRKWKRLARACQTYMNSLGNRKR